jgi:DNA-binding NarL/FixJ family response regulator
LQKSRVRVLVVDDFQPWREFVCSELGTLPWLEVIAQVSDGLDAVQKAQELQADLILLDIGLPTLNGIEAARRIRQSAPKTGIIFVSENRNRDIADAALSTGALGYITKSDAARELLHAVDAILHGQWHSSLGLSQPFLVKPELVQGLNDAASARQPNDRQVQPITAYENIVDDAVDIMRSDYASMQMLYPKRARGGELRLLAFRGFNPEAAKFWEWVRADSKSTCGIALRDGQRVVAPDIATCDFMTDSEDQRIYLQTGIRACQTTPLIAGAGNVVGMLSTHWLMPHHPSEQDFLRFDALAKQAADLIECCNREEYSPEGQ